MSDENTIPSALVVSADATVVEAIIGNNTTEQVFNARESVAEALDDPKLMVGNGIVIFDIDSTDSVDKAIDQAIKIKQADPTQVLMMVGEKEALGEILKSNIQPLVYRAFNKPVNPNQIFLAFKSAFTLNKELIAKQAAGENIMAVGPSENQASIDSLAADRKTNPAIYAGVGVLVLGVLAFLFLGGEETKKVEVVVDTAPDLVRELAEDDASNISLTNELNQQASNALLDGRYVSPESDNALYYYDQVLAIDPYDPIAYDGRKAIAVTLRSQYDENLTSGDFDKALEMIESLRTIDPLNLENDELAKNLSSAITAKVKEIQENGTPEEIERTSAVLDRLGDAGKGAKSAVAALQAEQVLIGKIDAALESGNLIPPKKDNAYSLVSNALKSNKISKTNSEPRVEKLSSGLLGLANKSFEAENMEDTAKYASLVKRLNVDKNGLTKLTDKIQERQDRLAAEKAEAEAEAAPAEEVAKVEEVVKPAPVKIIPAKIISREAPRYPARALKNGVEGWVEVMFHIAPSGKPTDIEVISAEPEGTFNTAAVKSVEKWRFSPSRNQETGLAVKSSPVSTKVQFRLN